MLRRAFPSIGNGAKAVVATPPEPNEVSAERMMKE